jgi:hypothetical protein
MTDFEREDLELQFVMGSKFIDETKPETKTVPKEEKKCCETSGSAKPYKAVEAAWHPTKVHTWMDSLKGCVKWALTFGGLNMLIFYWQIAGLMAESIAVPCMWVCCALAGYGVGLNVWRGAK